MSGVLPSRLLIANRGEIAVRIARTARQLGVATVAVHPVDDAASLHVRLADEARQLDGRGAAAYLDPDRLVAVAVDAGCDALHPGYGFLAESPALAQACSRAGIGFVGPPVEVLQVLGDKAEARLRAGRAGIPVIAGTPGPVDVEEAAAFLASRPDGVGVVLKAVAGGGGRGMRVVAPGDDLAAAFARCASEATTAFGDGRVYAEEHWPGVRHVEVQIAGDGHGRVIHLGERECSVQRRHQKLIEIAPAPGIDDTTRSRLHDAAIALGDAVGYANLGTVEFLVSARPHGEAPPRFAFIEANARLQVEHTVTEEVSGLDLVEVQLRLAAGATLDEAVPGPVTPRGWAVQARINLEATAADGSSVPAAGTLTTYDLPSGPGVRVDGYGYTGYRTNPAFDPLLAKLIVHCGPGPFSAAAGRIDAALAECRIDGVATNLRQLRDVVVSDRFRAGDLTTDLVADLATAGALGATDHRPLHPGPLAAATGTAATPTGPVLAPGRDAVASPMPATVVEVAVTVGDEVAAGEVLVVLEAMKMEHEIRAPAAAVVEAVTVEAGATVGPADTLVVIRPTGTAATAATAEDDVDLDHIRPDLAEVLDRQHRTSDAARPAAVDRRHRLGLRTARENVADLCDDGSFVEYGALAVAAQRRRRSWDELIEKSPADGMVTGVGSVNGELFGDPAARCCVLAYDYTVFAGTQGLRNHAKTDRLISLAAEARTPLVLFAEGGGGRPGEDGGDYGDTFARFATLSGLVPMVGIVAGRCFAGNASLLGCCDVVIATEDANIGMGGPAMIEGGGLGVHRPDEIGPVAVQRANGVIDVVVADEAEAVDVARRYLSYFQGRLDTWTEPDQRELRRVVPENRLRVYDVRRVVDILADAGTVLELRRHYGSAMITALARIEGRPVGIVANNPDHLGGAIDSDGADKAARFLQLCDAFDLPVVTLVDTPGIMVGPDVETTALVRHSSRLFVIGANIEVPTFGVVLRKAYGLGGIAMTGGSYRANSLTVAWPTGEFGPMGLEGSVHLAYRNEMAAIDDPDERRAFFDAQVAREYARGTALRQATGFAIDDTIDPAETRPRLAALLASFRPPPPRSGKKRPWIDTW